MLASILVVCPLVLEHPLLWTFNDRVIFGDGSIQHELSKDDPKRLLRAVDSPRRRGDRP